MRLKSKIYSSIRRSVIFRTQGDEKITKILRTVDRWHYKTTVRKKKLVSLKVPWEQELTINPKDLQVSRILHRQRIYEEQTVEKIAEIVNEGDYVADIGAHIGFYTVLFSNMVGPNGMVLAFEPEPENYRFLKYNIKNAPYDNIRTRKICVADRNKREILNLEDKDKGGHTIKNNSEVKNKVTVECMPLDEITEEVDFMKVDVEGAEPLVFEGAKSILEKHQPKIVFELGDYDFVKVFNFISKFGYRIETLDGFVINDPSEITSDLVPESNLVAYPD